MHDETTTPDPMDDGSDDLLIRRAARELKAPVAFGADFDARVMAAVRAAAADEAVERRLQADDADPSVLPLVAPVRRAGPARRAWAWVASPRTLRVSPLAGLGVAAGLAFLMLGVARRPATEVVAAAPATPAATHDSGSITGGTARAGAVSVVPVASTGIQQVQQVQQVQFVLVAPSAKSVALVGDFNDWNAAATPLAPVRAGGVWTITVPLQPGRYTYNFVVDGTRVMPDPAAPAAPTDDFGTPASIVTVAGAQS